MYHSDIRGQSETVGTIFLLGVITIGISLVGGAAAFNYIDQESVNKPLVNLEIQAEDGDNVVVNHMGGESLDTGSTVIIVRGSILTTLAGADSFDGVRDGQFKTGESIRHHLGSRGAVKVFVVDEDVGEVVASEVITLPGSGEWLIENFNGPDRAEEGEDIEVSAEINNTADGELTQNVVFSVDGKPEDDEDITLSSGEQKFVEFDYTIDQGEDIQVAIATNDDSKSVEVTVEEMGDLVVENLTAPDEAKESEEIKVSAEINNTGTLELTQNITFSVNGTPTQTDENVAVSSGKKEINFTYEPTTLGEINVRISTDNDHKSETVNVNPMGASDLVALKTEVGDPVGVSDSMGDVYMEVPESYDSNVVIDVEHPFGFSNQTEVAPGEVVKLTVPTIFTPDSIFYIDEVNDDTFRNEVTIETSFFA